MNDTAKEATWSMTSSDTLNADWMALTNFSFDYSPFDSLLSDDIFDFRSSGSGLCDEFSRFGDGILKDDYDYSYLIANLGDDLGLGFGFRVSNWNFSNLFPDIRDIFRSYPLVAHTRV
ncbi:hypothetical protein NL676_018063 [Syzygium grande]|nr:hypothetical protein NL676_018063 [Syzygium grande]